MVQFFMNNLFCLTIYLVILMILMYSMTINKYKGYIMGIALILYVIDISILLVLGFSLLKCMIITGVIVIISIISIEEGKRYEL